jgi:DNA primase
MSQQVNFRELRQKLDFRAVLELYKVEVKIKPNGTQHHGFCPLPTHDGKKNSPSFSANLEKGIWQCFGCGAKGNVLEFAVRMEGLDPNNGTDFRKVAVKLQGIFFPATPAPRTKADEPRMDTREKEQEVPAPKEGSAIVNAPLDFELKDLDKNHPYLTGRGLNAETVEHFGLGYCSRGLLAGRIAIPLHDLDGELIGYAGRVIDDASIGSECPKYKFPGRREHNGAVFEFHKSGFLYNGGRRPCRQKQVVVVEGFPSVWWLWQNRYPNAVAIMGSTVSDEQVRLIVDFVDPRGFVWIFTDGDDAGIRCGEDLVLKIAPFRFTRWLRLSNGRQPTDCDKAELASFA